MLVFSQDKWKFQDDGCGATRWYGNESGSFNLEIKEQTITQPLKNLSINGGNNGGVRIIGWKRNEISIRACVQAFGANIEEARARTSAVRIITDDGFIRAVSSARDNYSFGANYDIRVPMNTNLTIKTINGGINLNNIRGSIEFDLNNGGAVFSNIAGKLRGKTVNGSLSFDLSGNGWEGDGIDASTINGNISISVPENYSARLETASRRGNLYINLPVSKIRDNKYELNLDLGNGGATIKALTNNGQITIKRKSISEAKTNE